MVGGESQHNQKPSAIAREDGPTKKIMVLVGRDALHLNQKGIHFGDPSI